MNRHHKRASFGTLSPKGGKTPVLGPPDDGFYNRMRACWRLQRLQMIGPYGWHQLNAEQLAYIREKLIEFEAKDWNQIFVAERDHNHRVDVAAFDCPAAREWMRRNMPDQDVLWTLRLMGKQRIWGIFRDGVFHLMFWDPEHQIKLSLKKHT